MRKPRVPKYCHHKATDRAYVTIRGRVIYLGKYDSPEGYRKYHQIVGEFLRTGQVSKIDRPNGPSYTVGDLAADFLSDPENEYKRVFRNPCG